ncbi:MAG: PHP domain-containing protein [Desulfobulbus propionicus]|nr:MAG: PHP domain-containing protein [Desulfobulbus propionicus]
MIDLHSHTFLSDGELVPSEHLRRVEVLGYQAMAITDHADSSNLEFLITNLHKAAADLKSTCSTRLIVGVELTHVPPPLIGTLTERARNLGAEIVVVHGESPVEPVMPGTNQAALQSGVDILAHPGFITLEQASLAAKNGILLELSGRKGHSLTNGHVCRVALQAGAKLAVNSDAHGPGDFLTAEMARKVGLGAGLSEQQYQQTRQWMQEFVEQL